MASIRLTVNSIKSLKDAWWKLKAFWGEHKYINITANDKRSLDQNAAIRVVYRQIVENWEGMTGKDVERHCKLNYGVPILAREDLIFGDIIKRLKRIYNYEQMLKIMDTLQVTSHDSFSTAMAGEFIESLINDFPYIKIEKPKDD